MCSSLGRRPYVSAAYNLALVLFLLLQRHRLTKDSLGSLTVTQSVATPTTITLSTGAGAIAIWEDEDLTMEGRATEVRNIAVETETTTHTTSIVVGKFTQVC